MSNATHGGKGDRARSVNLNRFNANFDAIFNKLFDMPRRNTSLQYMWNMYNAIYSKRLGNNFWAVYNAMTDWSTHFEAPRSSSMANIASVQNDRQEVIRQTLNAHTFLSVAA